MRTIKPKLFRGNDEKRIRKIPNETLDVVILNTRFDLLTKEGPSPTEAYALCFALLHEAGRTSCVYGVGTKMDSSFRAYPVH